MPPIVEAHGLTKHYGEVTALGGLDLHVEEGTVVGLLGPNGAGKTTAVSILTTLVPLDGGRATVAGVDVAADPAEVRRRIGVSGQSTAVDELLTGRQNLEMVGRLHHLGRQRAADRANELLERFDLAEAADRPAKTYSGGMRRRLDLAGALVADVPVLFLDEPTTGLDPRSRLQLWDVIRELVQGGKTLLLTTQYLEEADQLADEIVVIDRGLQIAKGTADQLKSSVGGERIEMTLHPAAEVETARRTLAATAGSEVHVDGRSLTVQVEEGPVTLTRVLVALEDAGVPLVDVGLRRPSLDDVFLSITGHAAHESEADDVRSDELVEVAS